MEIAFNVSQDAFMTDLWRHLKRIERLKGNELRSLNVSDIK